MRRRGASNGEFIVPPVSCGSELETLDWAGTLSIPLPDGRLLGFRSNAGEVLDAVAAAVPGARPTDGATVYYSVVVGEAGRRRAHPRHLLYRGGSPMLATRSAERLVAAVAGFLDAHLRLPSGLVFDTVPISTTSGVVLVPPTVLGAVGAFDPALSAHRLRLADVPFVAVDPVTMTVDVAAPALRVGVPPGLARSSAGAAVEPTLAPGRHVVRRWLVRPRARYTTTLRAAETVLHVADLVRRPWPADAASVLAASRDLATGLPVAPLMWRSQDELVAALAELGG